MISQNQLLTILFVVLLSFCTAKKIPYSYHAPDEIPESYEKPIPPKEKETDSLPETNHEQTGHSSHKFAEFSTDSIKIYVKAFVDSIHRNKFFRLGGCLIFSKHALPEMYQGNGFQLNWHERKNRSDAIECLERSWMDGLDPQDYHLNEIQSLREDIRKNSTLDYKEIAEFDVLLTDGLLLYSFHLLKGKVNPRTLDVNWNFSSRALPQKPTKLFAEALEKQTIPSTVYSFRPKYAPYSRFMGQLIKYKTIRNNGGWGEVYPDAVIRPDETNSELPSIRKRLYLTGDIESEDAFVDSVYDENTVDAIKRFQRRHGLSPDGVIGKNTITALNIPVEKKIDQIKVNMERARWILNEIGEQIILVNIANFRLFYLRDSTMIYTTKVMTGTYYHQTPVFKSKMKYLVFNPTWTVPYSIATNELLPKLKKDPSYLSTRNMTLLNSEGKPILQSSVDWSGVSKSHFPYTIRQEPGNGNALGQVKFIFPNKYSVYLHDTPSKYLFAQDERAFSHGCIRVQNPLDLAEVLLNDEKWNREKIREVINEKKERIVNLKKPVDVLLLYWTCGFTHNNDIFFIRDVYRRDEKVLSGLQNDDWEKLMKEYQEEIGNEVSIK